MALAIELRDLRKSYGCAPALSGVDLSVGQGSVLGLLGPNGAGKTTMVRILTTLIRPDRGSARVCGLDVVRDAAEVRPRIGLAGQNVAIDQGLTGPENLELFARLHHLGRRESRGRADELLERFGLGERAGDPVSTYSGGMRRRLDLAIALVARPAVLFLDEPTTGLDPRSRIGLWETIADRVADGTTVLLTTQYLEEADRLADQIAVIDHGLVIAEGTPAQLKDRVGGTRLEVRLQHLSDAPSAAAALAPVSSEQPVIEDELLHALVPQRDGVVAEALRRLDRAGVAVTDLALCRPTLDDVFLQLTGESVARSEKVAA